MGNCQMCKHKQYMGNLVGCSKYRKIIVNPYEQQTCYEYGSNIVEDLIRMAQQTYKGTANVY